MKMSRLSYTTVVAYLIVLFGRSNSPHYVLQSPEPAVVT